MDYSSQEIVNLLSSNMMLLSSYPIGYVNKLQNENESMKDEINHLRESNSNLRKRNFDYRDELDQVKKRKREREEDPIRVVKFRKNKDSLNDEEISRLISNIKNLKDMENLNEKYRSVRHNEMLYKMCNLHGPLKKINNMVGLESVKKEIFKKIIYYLKNPNNEEYLHTVLSGPPGVGKTELAKIYGEIFSKLGILKTNKFTQIKRDNLVAEYLGQTSHRTKKLLEEAMGGVLFLDEAYSLGNREKRDSFAKEAIDMINQYLSERKNDFMFVIAGYEKELDDCFFSINPGLKRRFSTFFNIDKYSSDELSEIFKSKIRESKYELDVKDNELKDFFKINMDKFENYAGDVEKLINEMKYCQSYRTFSENINSKKMIFKDLINSVKIFKEKEDKSYLNNLYI